MKILDQNHITNLVVARVIATGRPEAGSLYGRTVLFTPVKPGEKCACGGDARFCVVEGDGSEWSWCGECGDGGG